MPQGLCQGARQCAWPRQPRDAQVALIEANRQQGGDDGGHPRERRGQCAAGQGHARVQRCGHERGRERLPQCGGEAEVVRRAARAVALLRAGAGAAVRVGIGLRVGVRVRVGARVEAMIGLRAGARPWLGLGRGGLGLEAVQSWLGLGRGGLGLEAVQAGARAG